MTLNLQTTPVNLPHGIGQTMFERLSGRWRQSRTIVPGGQYMGVAHFVPAENGCLRYTEEGVLTPDGVGPVQSRRTYLYKIDDGRIDVLFDESPPRLFHSIEDFQDSGSDVVSHESMHVCGQDTYRSTYEFRSDKSFVIRHRVTGPRKNYVMTTVYTRWADAEAG